MGRESLCQQFANYGTVLNKNQEGTERERKRGREEGVREKGREGQIVLMDLGGGIPNSFHTGMLPMAKPFFLSPLSLPWPLWASVAFLSINKKEVSD
jgi:hypothetical protein